MAGALETLMLMCGRGVPRTASGVQPIGVNDIHTNEVPLGNTAVNANRL
jgi:hypothetical protein